MNDILPVCDGRGDNDCVLEAVMDPGDFLSSLVYKQESRPCGLIPGQVIVDPLVTTAVTKGLVNAPPFLIDNKKGKKKNENNSGINKAMKQ